jgi:hypothetical protein
VAAVLRLVAKAAMFTGNLSRIYDRFTERAERTIEGPMQAGSWEVGEPLLTGNISRILSMSAPEGL